MGENRSRSTARVASRLTESGSPDPGPYRFYGRRSGRPLRPNRRRLLAELLPRVALDLQTVSDPGWPQPSDGTDVWLEIGFGGGEHLAWQAAEHPDVLLIGAEPFVNGVASLLALIDADGCQNIRIWPEDVRPLLDILPDGCLGRLFVLHPDPWPKARHAARRIISQDTLKSFARLLKPGAILRIASDDQGYIDWVMLQAAALQTSGAEEFEWLADTAADWRDRPPDWPETRYAVKASRNDRSAYFLQFRRR